MKKLAFIFSFLTLFLMVGCNNTPYTTKTSYNDIYIDYARTHELVDYINENDFKNVIVYYAETNYNKSEDAVKVHFWFYYDGEHNMTLRSDVWFSYSHDKVVELNTK